MDHAPPPAPVAAGTTTAARSVLGRLEPDLLRVRRSVVAAAAAGLPTADAPFTHYVRRQGRLFRPVLTLVSAYVCDGPRTPSQGDRLIAAATAVELLHLATLCHDDLCDRAATRRGHPTVNAEFGDDAALLAGDHLIACAMSVLAGIGGDATRIAGETLKELCLGQLLELDAVHRLDRTEGAYFTVVSGKTAALMAACARLGASAAGASEADRDIMARFGHSLGVAFQIWDDVLDIWAPPGITGKPPGKDVENGVFTLPVIHALRQGGTELPRLLTRRPFTPRDHEAVVRELDRLGSRRYAVEAARARIADALAGVRELGSSVDAVAPLVEVARHLMPEIDHLLPQGPGPDGEGTAP
ncbi:polyprenyl synthetase family protein [Streptomyces sp. NPDC058953]|uniref:polyprenyl synthetase family protein n=1 Tax=unclassified Streptomyces TaxID=2593676 RepID=UPI0036B8576B